VQWSLEAGNFAQVKPGVFMDVLTGLGRGSHWAYISRAFLDELVWLAPLLGEGKNFGKLFTHQHCGRSMKLCIYPLECRNVGLHLLRM
jgi:hypothetical protein